MPNYDGKLLELLSIDSGSENSTIIAMLTLEKKVKLEWGIDDYTADQLKALTIENGNYKYRVSFHYFWDYSKKQYYSYLTKTYRDYTEKVFFSCSESFVNDLKAMKALTDLNELKDLPPFSITLPKKKLIQNIEKTKKGQFYPKVNRLIAAIISLSVIILMGFSGHFYINETPFAKKVTATSPENHHKSLPLVDKQKNQPEMKTNIESENKETQTKSRFPSAKLNDTITYNISEGSVALTFDDGPSKYTKAIVDVLTKHHAGGTFFFVGQNVKKYPDSVQYVNSNCLTIGNHSMNHPDFSNLSYQQQTYELTETNKLIEQITSQPVMLFRPPYEAENELTVKLMHQNHMKMVLWNRDTEDWKTHNSTAILNYITHTESSGSIILLHESQAVLNVLPKIIEYLQNQNLEVVNLEE